MTIKKENKKLVEFQKLLTAAKVDDKLVLYVEGSSEDDQIKVTEANKVILENHKDLLATKKKVVKKPKEVTDEAVFPFKVRVHGLDLSDALGLEAGKTYKVEAIKKMITQKDGYFELHDAEFKYDKKFNAVYPVMSSAKKG